MSTFTLRPATSSELSALVALVNSAYRGESSRAGWTTEADLLGGQRTDLETLRQQLSAANGVLLVAEADGGELLGCVFLERVTDAREPEAYLGMLTVPPLAQGAGLGKAILAQAEAYAAQHWGARAVVMTVIAQREDILAWYARRGYSDTGETQPFPYGDPRFGLPRRRDLFFKVLRKTLPASPAS
ncbi:MAG TPA: GNAT family N-acetyltransferase [Polyangiales bacterium]|nr:GNAT family N-acetyltransferase [Polyangiales bacterium]